jgi:hypothetical protein
VNDGRFLLLTELEEEFARLQILAVIHHELAVQEQQRMIDPGQANEPSARRRRHKPAGEL